MTTVGYGDVFAVSPYGKVISIINALWGAFVISALVASINEVFSLSENQQKAVAEITNSKQAAASIRASIQYYNAKNNRLKNQEVPIALRKDYVYKKQDVNCFKTEMET